MWLKKPFHYISAGQKQHSYNVFHQDNVLNACQAVTHPLFDCVKVSCSIRCHFKTIELQTDKQSKGRSESIQQTTKIFDRGTNNSTRTARNHSYMWWLPSFEDQQRESASIKW